jgi:pilus assembly protein Flp/PilA
LIRSEEGATATEYAVMLALIIIVAIGAITILGKKVNNTFQNIANQLPNN